MQPTIIFTAGVAGMVFLNGRFAGEASGERPLFAPVAPSGAVYVEYRPLAGAGGLARRVVFSGGTPLPESLEAAQGLRCVAWPGGALEMEFCPAQNSSLSFALEGLPCALNRGEETELSLNGISVSLPEGALPPRLLRAGGAAALLGQIEGGGQYLASLSPDLAAQTGLLTADSIAEGDGGLFSCTADLGDSVGHGRLEQWLLDASGLRLVSSENVWSRGAPHWPQTGEGAVIAAVEAALAGLPAEAEGYLSPALAATRPLDAVGDICDMCAPMKYALPDARPCVALVKAVNDRLAVARPLFYRAEYTGGRQGPWQVEALSAE